jgi:cell division protein ZapA
MASVELHIGGKPYTIACDPGQEEQVKTLAKQVDARAKQLGPSGSEAQRMLMVCLMLADELQEAKGNPLPPDEEKEVLVAAVEHLAGRIDKIAAKLAR